MNLLIFKNIAQVTTDTRHMAPCLCLCLCLFLCLCHRIRIEGGVFFHIVIFLILVYTSFMHFKTNEIIFRSEVGC